MWLGKLGWKYAKEWSCKKHITLNLPENLSQLIIKEDIDINSN